MSLGIARRLPSLVRLRRRASVLINFAGEELIAPQDGFDPEPTSDPSRKRMASRHHITAGLRSLKTEMGGRSCEFDFYLCSAPRSYWSQRVLPPDQKRMSLPRR